MKISTLRIAWLWIGASAIGYMLGGFVADWLFAAPPYDPGALQGPKNQYDWREAGYALSIGTLFAVSQWLVLRYVLAVYRVPRNSRALWWIPASATGIATAVFFTPVGMPMFFLAAAIIPTIPGMAVLGLGQWLILYWLANVRFIWIFLTIIGGAAGVYMSVFAGMAAGAAASALTVGACIGIFQTIILTQELDADLRRRGSTTADRHSGRETTAAIVIALILGFSIAPAFLAQQELRNVNSIRYSPNGSQIAADVENYVYVWDSETAELLWQADSGRGQRIWNPGHELTFSPDGRRIAVGSYGLGAILVDARSGERIASVNHERIGDIAFSPDGSRLAVTGPEGLIFLHDAESGDYSARFQISVEQCIEAPSINSVTFGPADIRLFAGGSCLWSRGSIEGPAAVWGGFAVALDLAPLQQRFVINENNAVSGISVSGDASQILTASRENAKVWSAQNGEMLVSLDVDCPEIFDATFVEPLNQIIVVCSDGSVHRCPASGPECTHSLSRPLSPSFNVIVAMSVHPDGSKIVTSDLAGVLETWNIESGAKVRRFKIPSVD